MKRRGLGLVLLAGLGCSGERQYLPLEPGTTWSYTVRTPLVTHVSDLTVASEVSGYREIRGSMGRSLIEWRDGALWARELSGTRFEPPIPLLRPGVPSWRASWRGRVEGPFPYTSATASLRQSEEELSQPTRKLPTIKCVLSLEIGPHLVELETWFARGVGIVRQEQRVDGRFALAMEHLRGPAQLSR